MSYGKASLVAQMLSTAGADCVLDIIQLSYKIYQG